MPSSKGLRKDELKEKWEKFWNNYIRPSKYPLSGFGAQRIFDKYIEGTEPPYRIDSPPLSVTGEIRGADGFSATLSVRRDYVRGPESKFLRMGPEELHRYYKEKLVPTGITVSVENEEYETIGQVKWELGRNDLTQRLEPMCGLQFHPGFHYLSHLSKPYDEGLPQALRFLLDIAEVALRHSPADEPWVY